MTRRFFSIQPSPTPARRPWSLRARLALSNLPALLLVIVGFAGIALALRWLDAAEHQVLESHRGLSLVSELEKSVSDVESAHRGFLLAGDERQLESYREGVREVWAVYGELRHRSPARAAQHATLSEIIGLFDAWKKDLAEPSIEQRRRARALDSAWEPGAALSQPSPQLAALREKSNSLRASTRALLTQAEESQSFAATFASTATLVFPLLILACMAAAGLWVALRTARALEVLRGAADRVADGELEVHADVSGCEEAVSVARAFNSMAHQLAQRTQRANLLAEIGETLQACTSFDEACRVLSQVAPRLLPETSGTLSVFNASRNAVLPVASWGNDEPSGTGFDPDDCWSLRKGRVHLYHPPRHGVACHHVDARRPDGAHVCIPMVAQGDPVGVLHLIFERTSAQQINAVLETATTAAERFALALANLRLRDSLRDRSIRDSLTGLFNRRYLEETLDREFGRAEREHQPVSILVLDVDHFKRFNDQHGHEAGDAILAHMGRLLQDTFRTSDIPCRYGGEEFVVVMPDAALVDAVHRAEKLREIVANQLVEHRGQRLGPVTLSIGVAAYPGHGMEPGEVLRSADAALYTAKKAGRNRVTIAPDPARLSSPPSYAGRRTAA